MLRLPVKSIHRAEGWFQEENNLKAVLTDQRTLSPTQIEAQPRTNNDEDDRVIRAALEAMGAVSR